MTGAPGSLAASLLGLGAGAVLVCAVMVLWRGSTAAVVRVVALQGLALAMVAAVLGLVARDVGLLVTAGIVLVVKAGLVPRLLGRVIRDNPYGRETRPLVNFPASLVVAAGLTFLAYGATAHIVAGVGGTRGHLVPIGVATLLIGFLVAVSRRKAVFQILGILLVDNGIALVAFLVTAGVPLLVELGVSLDVFLAVGVLQVLAVRMRAEFGSLDLDELTELHD